MVTILGQNVRANVVFLVILESLAVYAAVFALATYFVQADGIAGFSISAVLPTVLMVLLINAFGIYEPEARADIETMTARLSLACVVGCLIAFLLIRFFSTQWISPLYAITCASLGYVSVLFARVLAQRFLHATATRNRILLLGAGSRAERVRDIANRSNATDFAAALEITDSHEPGRLMDMVRNLDISEIVVAEERGREVLPVKALLDCKGMGIRVSDFTAHCERETGRVDLDNIYPGRLIFTENAAEGRISRVAKRIMDITVSGLGLLVLAPLLVPVAIAIRLDTPGPVFYRQTRVGLNDRPFEIVKFRSMRQDAEKGGAKWAEENDPRITRVGRFIRQTRIDELPQLINILVGHMSLVGPRPERPVFVEELSHKIPYYSDRHRIKPGLTGWAQINYRYGATDEDAKCKLQYDLYYVRNRGLLLDVFIIMRTARAVLWPDGVH